MLKNAHYCLKMEPRTQMVNHCKNVVCNAGDTIMGNHNQIKFSRTIKVMGNHNTIYCDNSKIYGNHNRVFGDCNMLYGNHNKTEGRNNDCIGSFNNCSTSGSTRTGKPTTNTKYFANFVMHSGDNAVNYFDGVYVPSTTGICMTGKPDYTNSFIGSIGNGSSTTITTKNTKSEPVPVFPTTEDLDYDEDAAEGDEANTCIVCLERKRKCVIRPCKHFSLCVACSKKTLEKCPVCRTKITAIERLFL